jgi:Ser/Thr protein kinase RdoA (MazF antagonist)
MVGLLSDILLAEATSVNQAVARRMLPKRDYRTLPAPEGPRQVVLLTYAPGREAYRDEGYAVRYGRSFAEVHAASADFRSGHRRFQLDLTVLLERPLARIAPLLAHRPADWRYLQGLAAEARGQVEALAAAGLDWGFCHGDTLGSNAHLDGDVITHYDFDDCGPGWRAYDLATFVWIWTWHEKPERAQAFLQGDSERRPNADVDRRAVPLFVVLREVWVIGQQTRGAATLGRYMMDDAYFDARLRFLRSWEQHPPAGCRGTGTPLRLGNADVLDPVYHLIVAEDPPRDGGPGVPDVARDLHRFAWA